MTTGTWSEAAINEAKKYGEPNEIANNKQYKYAHIDEPSTWKIKEDATFFHYCDNETIQGFEFHQFPFNVVPQGQLLVCDMSSNFCSKPIDWSKYDVVYAGAQKNVGPAGVTFVILKNAILKRKAVKDIPLTSDWVLFSKAANTFHNTPTCWSIYMAGLNLEYMLEIGGLPKMQELAEARSKMLYSYIDNSDGFYSNNVKPEFRSRMNIPFRVKSDEELEKKFLAQATAAGLLDLAGHRSVGGCRASLYNAMTIEGVEALVAFMKTFKEANSQ